MAKLTEMQTLILWALLGAGGESAAIALKPEVKKPDRQMLVKSGLITAEKRGRGFWLEVTDSGWAWAADNLVAELPKRSMAGSAVLRAWLERLNAFMQARNFSLADILGPQVRASRAEAEGSDNNARPPQIVEDAELRARIRNAYLQITGGAFNARALLRDLRQQLPDIDKRVLDETLKRMQNAEEAILMQLDNRLDVTEADREAAIRIGQEPRHILWISR